MSPANLSSRTLVGILGGLLLLALLLVFAVNQISSGDGDDPTPTSTAESVLAPVDDVPGAASTPDTEQARPTQEPDDGDEEPTETEAADEPRRGGDNQRGEPTTTPEGTTGSLRAERNGADAA